jgi:antitoxin ParD1/3/4
METSVSLTQLYAQPPAEVADDCGIDLDGCGLADELVMVNVLSVCYSQGADSIRHKDSQMMNITLTPQLEGWVEEQVAIGRYHDASELVREAVQLLEEQSRYEALRAAVQEGFEEAERGEVVPLDMEAAIRAANENSLRGRKVDPIVLP